MVAALELVTNRKKANPSNPLVINLSFGAYIGTSTFTALDEAVQAAIDAGVVVVVSAGNDGKDASLYSPAHVPDAITVGRSTQRARSSRGSRTTASLSTSWRPGDRLEVLFAGNQPNKLMQESGTSFAAPHVAGAAAVVLARNPTWTPQQVRDHLVQRAENGSRIDSTPSGTTDRMLNMDKLGETP